MDKKDNNDNESKDKNKKKIKAKLAKSKSTATKEKYENVESRIEKSTNDWVNKKLIDAKPKTTCGPKTSSTATSSTGFSSKSFSSLKMLSSTPYAKPLDLTTKDDSFITREENKEAKKTRSRRKSIFNFNFSDNKDSSQSSSVCGSSDETKNKELEELIVRTRYLQSTHMLLTAKLMNKQLDEQAINQIDNIWQNNNELRKQLLESKTETNLIQEKCDLIQSFECLRKFLSKYVSIRKHIDPLYVSFAQLIHQQKLFIKLESEDEHSFDELEKCANSLTEMKSQLHLFDDLYEVSVVLKNVADIKKDIDDIKHSFSEHDVQYYEQLLLKKANYQKTNQSFDKQTKV